LTGFCEKAAGDDTRADGDGGKEAVLIVFALANGDPSGTVAYVESVGGDVGSGMGAAGGAEGVGSDGVDSDSVDSDGVDSDGVDSDGVDLDGVDAGGVDSNGVDSGGVDSGGVASGGVDSAGVNSNGVSSGGAGSDSVGSGSVGSDSVGSEGTQSDGVGSELIDGETDIFTGSEVGGVVMRVDGVVSADKGFDCVSVELSGEDVLVISSPEMVFSRLLCVSETA
jgi:hypothetical protein